MDRTRQMGPTRVYLIDFHTRKPIKPCNEKIFHYGRCDIWDTAGWPPRKYYYLQRHSRIGRGGGKKGTDKALQNQTVV